MREADDELLRRLPLPIAQLLRRTQNAKSALERHLTAFYLWEAGLKLLASVAIVEYARLPEPDPKLAERLASLARPSLGHWWEFVRLLVPVLAERGDPHFVKVRDLLLGKSRDDLPRATGLDAFLRERLEGKAGARTTVRLTELFDQLVAYRNKVLGHAAPGRLSDDVNHRGAEALVSGLTEIYRQLDMLVGRRLVYVSEVRQVGGQWLVQQLELAADGARRIPSLELPHTAAANLPFAERLHLERPDAASGDLLVTLDSLHPLVLYLPESEEVLFLNSRSGKQKTEYLCYTTGRSETRTDLGSERRELLACVLKIEVSPSQEDAWSAKSLAEEPSDEQGSQLSSPRMIGEFELLSELGRGGMGIVYRAWQPSLRRQVALKRLLHVGDPKTDRRFQREIRALGRVEHPHLVKIFTAGSDGDHWFYAMELVEGAPLSAVCDRLTKQATSADRIDLPTWRQALSTVCEQARQEEKPLNDPAAMPRPSPASIPALLADNSPAARRDYVRNIAELVRQAAEAAHTLHEAGIIHRDIKPGNIMVTQDGSQAVLMDLGLAQLADDEEGRLTRTRQFVGTLRYASPQQVLAVGQPDRRNDVYSLGATLWELLTLQPLFGATDQMPTPTLMEKIQRDEPPSPRQFQPKLPRDLEVICLKCLEKSADRRYATARDLAADLQRFQNDELILARPASLGRRFQLWRRRHALLTTLGLTIASFVLLSCAGLAGFAILGQKIAADQMMAFIEDRRVVRERIGKIENLRWQWMDSLFAEQPQDHYVIVGTRGNGRLIITYETEFSGRMLSVRLRLDSGDEFELLEKPSSPISSP